MGLSFSNSISRIIIFFVDLLNTSGCEKIGLGRLAFIPANPESGPGQAPESTAYIAVPTGDSRIAPTTWTTVLTGVGGHGSRKNILVIRREKVKEGHGLPYAGVEAGGTKFECIVGTGPEDIRGRITIPTSTPGETLGKAKAFFRNHQPFAGIGIGSFGPCDVSPESPSYGHITTTPKPGWENTNILGYFCDAFRVPAGFDTDVNVAALGEFTWGSGQGLGVVLYITVGTGIGGGGIVNGEMMHGAIHPEMGHIRLPRLSGTGGFSGICPYHGDCLQGLASGPAMEARWGKPPAELPPDHPAWDLEARYLALALSNFIFTLSPYRIILGGGVMHQTHLFPLIRAEVVRLLNGYLQTPVILERIDEYIVPPGLGDQSGALGAIALAKRACGNVPF